MRLTRWVPLTNDCTPQAYSYTPQVVTATTGFMLLFTGFAGTTYT